MLLKISMKVNISLIQTDVTAGNPEKNFLKTKDLLQNLTLKKNHIAILPELWISGYSYNQLKLCSNYFKKNLQILQNIAVEKQLNIAGSVPWEENNIFFNRNIFIDNKGNIAGTYDKIHLFKPLKEDKFFQQGNEITIIKNICNIGLMLCYDLRFPELARKLAINGAQIIIVPAEWPLERISHWKLLNQARALENQLFIISCNRVGTSYNITFGGHSIIASPTGEILLELSEKEETETFEIDTALINKAKNNFNILDDIRLI